MLLVVAGIATTSAALAFASERHDGLALLALLGATVGLLRGRTWALLALAAVLAAVTRAMLAGDLPLVVLAASAPLATGVAALLWQLGRVDRLATLTALGLALATGALAHGGFVAASQLREGAQLGTLVDLRRAEAATPRPSTALGALTCRGDEASQREIRLSLQPIRLRPLLDGPRVGGRLGPEHRRGKNPLEAALLRRRLHLELCYRWARFHLSRAVGGTFRVSGRVGVWGKVSIRSVVPPANTPAHRALAKCVAGALWGLELDSARALVTPFEVPLKFVPSKQRPDRVPAAPGASKRERAPTRRCVRLAPVTRRAPLLHLDTFDVSDFDEQQAERERQRACRHRVCPPRVTISTGCALRHVAFTPSRMLHRVLRYNLGAYRDCYRAVLRRRPGLRGKIELRTAWGASGFAHEVRPVRSVDAALGRCLARAVSEVVIPPVRQGARLRSRVIFELDPTAPPALSPTPRFASVEQAQARARALLASGRAAAARRVYDALWRAAPRDARRCWWQVGALEAVLRERPWGDTTLRGPTDRLMAQPTGWDRACHASAARLVGELAMRAHRDAQRTQARGYLDQAIATYRLALQLEPAPRFDHELSFSLGEALFLAAGCSAALPAYLAASRFEDGRWRDHAASGLHYCLAKLGAPPLAAP
ncbi:MAG: hypothetical protein KC503_24795 [Myxococcales bacterium]|nr:hypothetical protein [Myxococcales bacterium]